MAYNISIFCHFQVDCLSYLKYCHFIPAKKMKTKIDLQPLSEKKQDFIIEMKYLEIKDEQSNVKKDINDILSNTSFCDNFLSLFQYEL